MMGVLMFSGAILFVILAAILYVVYTVHEDEKYVLQACEYDGFDQARIATHGKPSPGEMLRGLHKELDRLNERSKRLTARLKEVNMDAPFLGKSTVHFASLLRHETSVGAKSADKKKALCLATAGMCFSGACDEKLTEQVRSWGNDSKRWCTVVIEIGKYLSDDVAVSNMRSFR